MRPRASRKTLKSIQKALREALLTLPAEEYDWFDVRAGARGLGQTVSESGNASQGGAETDAEFGERERPA